MTGATPLCKPGSERYRTFQLYKDNMLVSEFLAKGGRISHLKRDIEYKHVAVTKK